MERKQFLQGLGLVGLGTFAIPLLKSCSTSDDGTSSQTGSCTVSPTETVGPFPTSKGDPSFFASAGYMRQDIRDGESGVPLNVEIIIKNTNNNCEIVSGAIVEIWHCNRNGYYSEFGPSNSGGMQSVDMTAYDFLRGKQATDDSGKATFQSVYPGWYNGRAPHIHVHIYSASGVSKLVTQIAFTESISTQVYTNSSFYNGSAQGTSNASDNVFSNSLAQNMCDTLTGDISNGYTLTKTIYVAF